MDAYDTTLAEISTGVDILETANIEMHALEQIKQIPGDISKDILAISMEDIKESLGYTPSLEADEDNTDKKKVNNVIIRTLKAIGKFIKSLLDKVFGFFTNLGRGTKKEEKRSMDLWEELAVLDKSIFNDIDITLNEELKQRRGRWSLVSHVMGAKRLTSSAIEIMNGAIEYADRIKDQETFAKATSQLITRLDKHDGLGKVALFEGQTAFVFVSLEDGTFLDIEAFEDLKIVFRKGMCLEANFGKKDAKTEASDLVDKIPIGELTHVLQHIPKDTLSTDLKKAEVNLKGLKKRMDIKLANITADLKKGDVDEDTIKLIRIVTTNVPQAVSILASKPINYTHQTYKMINDLGEYVLKLVQPKLNRKS